MANLKNKFHWGDSRSCLVSLPWFVVFLPAVYYSHFPKPFLPTFHNDPKAGPLAIGTYPEKPTRPYHDRNSCPICRADGWQTSDFFAPFSKGGRGD